jgi:acetyl-CoA acetyltransferase
MSDAPLMEYSVWARRLDAHASEASCKSARVELDTDLAGNPRHSMRRDGLKRGIVTLCIGGGQGIALAVELA